jgi:hypothetical protein
VDVVEQVAQYVSAGLIAVCGTLPDPKLTECPEISERRIELNSEALKNLSQRQQCPGGILVIHSLISVGIAASPERLELIMHETSQGNGCVNIRYSDKGPCQDSFDLLSIQDPVPLQGIIDPKFISAH